VIASTLFSVLFWSNSHNSYYGIILFQNLSCHHQELVTLMMVLWRMIILYVESPRIFLEIFFLVTSLDFACRVHWINDGAGW
jgi:hypothetical protein